MFFGQCTSPPTFQAFMDSAFGNMITEGWLVIYMDDVLVFADTKEECQEWMKQVLQWMKEEDLHLKLTKCTFDQTLVEYLGLVVKDREIHMDLTKLTAVRDWELPKSIKAVRSLIGFCNFYRKFIPNFSTLTQPLHDLTKQGMVFLWKKEQDNVCYDFFSPRSSVTLVAPPLTPKDSSTLYRPCLFLAPDSS